MWKSSLVLPNGFGRHARARFTHSQLFGRFTSPDQVARSISLDVGLDVWLRRAMAPSRAWPIASAHHQTRDLHPGATSCNSKNGSTTMIFITHEQLCEHFAAGLSPRGAACEMSRLSAPVRWAR